jgi:ABC-2 type transport system permease protein
VSRVWLILVREYLENVRTRAFLIGLVLTPVWMGLIFLVPTFVKDTEGEPQRIRILDETGILARPIALELEKLNPPEGPPRFYVEEEPDPLHASVPNRHGRSRVDELRQDAGNGLLVALVLRPSILTKEPSVEGTQTSWLWGASNLGAADTARLLERVVNEVVNGRILDDIVKKHNVERTVAQALTRPAIRYTPVTREGEEAGVATAVTPLLFMLFLFMGIVGISQMLISSTLEEKGNRVYEVLLSSLSPFQLMAGKILGICGVGFTLLALWSGGGLLAASLQGMGGLVTGAQVGLFVAYYFLGFLLIASLMVAVGSACNTLKEAQNLMAPISLLLALPVMISMIVMKDSNGTFATVASFFPPFTPFLMMARIASVPPPPTWQIAASLLLLAFSVWFAIRLAARVFRVGILLYGKPPRLGEIIRWMRAR